MRLTIVFSILLVYSSITSGEPNLIYSNSQDPRVEFAVHEIADALKAELGRVVADSANASIFLLHEPNAASRMSERFQLQIDEGKAYVRSADAAGLMYGGLELAEQIRLVGFEKVKSTVQDPYMRMRGTKFNIPLDVRTPSYTDASDVAQHNIQVVWSMAFWKEYIDQLARYRYNFVSCWSLHPFPSLIKVPKYPEIALDNVHRSKVDWQEYYDLGAIGLDAPEIVDNYEVIAELTIEEKIAFWKEVMRYGKTRNVDFYFVTWNIFVNGTRGQYGITVAADNEITRDYFRQSVATLFRTYPDLAGIGLTTGENMKGISFQEKEDWAYDSYARGVLDVAREMPDRKITFIHRQHQADPTYIASKFKPLIDQPNVDFIYSFKYAKAHVFSAIRQPYHEDFVQNIGNQETIWTLRNDDAYYFKWGSPIFVRDFIRGIPYEMSRGMYYGSDQWIWGREFTSKNPVMSGQLEIDKHWYHWMMWGRLSFNPDLSNDFFKALLQDKFPSVKADILFQAWHLASMIYPITTGFHWGRVDFMWYIEGCRSRPNIAGNKTGFHDVNTFISFPVHDYAGVQSIPDYVTMKLAGDTTSLSTPLEVGQRLLKHANEASGLIQQLNTSDDLELAATARDITTICHMGRYYAHKIAGSTYLALYRETANAGDQVMAIEELTEALAHWEKYSEMALKHHVNPIWTNRVGNVDWAQTTKWVADDIEIAKKEDPKK